MKNNFLPFTKSKKLLNIDKNAKTVKGQKFGYMTAILYLASSFSCIFYTPNRKALKELIAAWPNIEDLIKGRSMWREDK